MDELVELDFSCPDPKIQKYWELLIGDVKSRDNVKPAHLRTLETLCRLYVLEDKCWDFIQENGYSYESENPRSGELQKEYIEVKKYEKILAEIRQYNQLLGLKLEKDKEHTKAKQGADDWK